jgi:hypothetical protein
VRLYSVAVTSLAVNAPLKWTDNLLAHHDIPEVRSQTRGVARGVSWAGLVRIALIRDLHVGLGCGVREAVALSGELLQSPKSSVAPGPWLTLGVDREDLERHLHRRLTEVLESAPSPRRGRPARRTRAGAPEQPE